MSNNTVPQITAAGSDSSTEVNPGYITLRLYSDFENRSEPATDVLLKEDAAAEIISDLAYALRGTASYGALAALVHDWFEAVGS